MSAWWLLLPLAVLTLLPWAIGVWEDGMTDLRLKRAREAQQAVVDSTDYSEIEKSAQVRVAELEAELDELRAELEVAQNNARIFFEGCKQRDVKIAQLEGAQYRRGWEDAMMQENTPEAVEEKP